jgi:propionyl-CoA carboxylase beta chain
MKSEQEKGKLEILDQKNSEALLGGGQARLDAQHQKGKLTAREVCNAQK